MRLVCALVLVFSICISAFSLKRRTGGVTKLRTTRVTGRIPFTDAAASSASVSVRKSAKSRPTSSVEYENETTSPSTDTESLEIASKRRPRSKANSKWTPTDEQKAAFNQQKRQRRQDPKERERINQIKKDWRARRKAEGFKEDRHGKAKASKTMNEEGLGEGHTKHAATAELTDQKAAQPVKNCPKSRSRTATEVQSTDSESGEPVQRRPRTRSQAAAEGQGLVSPTPQPKLDSSRIRPLERLFVSSRENSPTLSNLRKDWEQEIFHIELPPDAVPLSTRVSPS